MVSLKDIANELDLSVGLVSKVLSGKMGNTGVSAEKREKIISTARARGFSPNRVAMALRAGRVGTVGVFVHPWGEPGSELVEHFLQGFSQVLAISDYHLWLTYYEHDTDIHPKIQYADIRRQADALVVAGLFHPALVPQFEELDRNGLPVILSEEDAPLCNLVNISADTYQQGRMPTEHLISLGCRRIAQINVMPSRHRGYLDAMGDAGLSTEGLIVNTPLYGVEVGRACTLRLLDSGVNFDGLVCHTDNQALGAMQVLQARGIRVPEQVRVTGVDDTPLCTMSMITISSVTSEARRLGMETCTALLRRLEGETISSQLIKPRLIPRQSTMGIQ